MQKHEIVAQKMMLDIFNNKLRPNTKLPAERQLSADLGVDRTSLRIALKQLEALQVLDIRHGDGIYVRDYKKFAGIDFLRMLTYPKEETGGDIFLNEYMIQEIWTFWVEFMPLMIQMAMVRLTPMEMKQFIDIFDEELENLENPEKLVQLEAVTQEIVAEKTGNLVILLISNSTRQMRTELLKLFISSLDRDTLEKHIRVKRAVMRGFLTGEISDPGILAAEHKKLLASYWDHIRKSLKLSAKDRNFVSEVISEMR